jgi:anti-anti-sigma factor
VTITVLPPSAGTLRCVRLAFATGTVHDEGTRTVVVLAGESDFSTTSVAADALSWAMAWSAGDVVVDLAALEFIDSATVRVLAHGRELLEESGRRLSFRGPSRVAAHVLDAFGLTDLIETGEAVRP